MNDSPALPLANSAERSLDHVAIIMDGNRTWATEQGLSKMKGHTEGAQNIQRIAEATLERGIPYLTLYALSTENLKNRSETELKHLFSLFCRLVDYRDLFHRNQARFNWIGRRDGLPTNVHDALSSLQKETTHYLDRTLTLAINYGGRDEIVRAAQMLSHANQEITEEALTGSLDTAGLPEVDLMIRTGGYQRTSNFLPWQSIYAELYFTDVRWPAFSANDLDEAIAWYRDQKMKRGR